MLYAVVMAGGSGTRFWPASRNAWPKQLLDLSGSRTMIQATVDRLEGCVPQERMLVLTNEQLISAVQQQLPDLPTSSILGEPCRRDTAPCIGLAAELLLARDPEAIMVVLPADHVIEPVSQFLEAIHYATRLVRDDPTRIITFGIRPTFPAETYGYIERDERLNLPARGSDPMRGNDLPAGDDAGDLPPVFRARKFREKPSVEVAKLYLASGNFYWNAGIFVWSARTILDALRQYEPRMCEHLDGIAAARDRPDFRDVFHREFAAIQGKSIDFAVMEHYPNVLVVEAPFTWDDVGSWRSVSRLLGVDQDENTILGKHLGIRTSGCIIRSDDQHLVATVGLKDCIVVHTADATLVANKNDEESVRQVVQMLRDRGWDEHL